MKNFCFLTILTVATVQVLCHDKSNPTAVSLDQDNIEGVGPDVYRLPHRIFGYTEGVGPALYGLPHRRLRYNNPTAVNVNQDNTEGVSSDVYGLPHRGLGYNGPRITHPFTDISSLTPTNDFTITEGTARIGNDNRLGIVGSATQMSSLTGVNKNDIYKDQVDLSLKDAKRVSSQSKLTSNDFNSFSSSPSDISRSPWFNSGSGLLNGYRNIGEYGLGHGYGYGNGYGIGYGSGHGNGLILPNRHGAFPTGVSPVAVKPGNGYYSGGVAAQPTLVKTAVVPELPSVRPVAVSHPI